MLVGTHEANCRGRAEQTGRWPVRARPSSGRSLHAIELGGKTWTRRPPPLGFGARTYIVCFPHTGNGRRPRRSFRTIAGRPRDTRLLDPKIESIVQAAINDLYLTRERPRFSDLMKDIRARCHAEQLDAPDYRTVKRRRIGPPIRSASSRSITPPWM